MLQIVTVWKNTHGQVCSEEFKIVKQLFKRMKRKSKIHNRRSLFSYIDY